MDITTLNEILIFTDTNLRAVEKLPETGQREVFIGTVLSTNIKCVIKLCVSIPVNIGRIQREIRILGGLNSEYFPSVYYQSFVTDSILSNFYDSFDTRIAEQKQRVENIRGMRIKPFLLTSEEYIEHIKWGDLLVELKNERVLVDLLINLFNALSLLWEAQIAHRDLKPDNILLRPNLIPVIIDLGIAKSFRPDTLELTLLHSPCTPRFASPEQLNNKKNDITYKTDQFAIGVIAYNLLTGQFPYGDICEIQGQIIDNFNNERLGNIFEFNDTANEQLVKFIEKLLQVHPYKRFRSVEAIIRTLQDIKGSIA